MNTIFVQNNAIPSRPSATVTEAMSTIKVTVIGDTMVGKTCLISCYTRQELPFVYVPTTYDACSVNTMCREQPFNLFITDTSGAADEKAMAVALTGSQVVIVCFSLIDRKSYRSVKVRWLKDCRFHCESAPIVLVGLKSDLKDAVPRSVGVVSKQEVKELQREVGVVCYHELCAAQPDAVADVFKAAVKAVAFPEARRASLPQATSVFYV